MTLLLSSKDRSSSHFIGLVNTATFFDLLALLQRHLFFDFDKPTAATTTNATLPTNSPDNMTRKSAGNMGLVKVRLTVSKNIYSPNIVNISKTVFPPKS